MVNLEENNIYFYFNKNKLIHNFNDFSYLGNIYYPLKTNSNKIVIETLKEIVRIKFKDEDDNNFYKKYPAQ